MPPVESDQVLRALDDLVAALTENSHRNAKAIQRAQRIRALREQGLSYREIVDGEDRPLVVEMATANLQALRRCGGRLRRAEARVLHREGMTMDRIAELFGVTRQRVSALIRDGDEDKGPPSHPGKKKTA